MSVTFEKLIQDIIDHCEALASEKIKPNDNDFGLCMEISDKFEVRLKDFVDFSKWPENYYLSADPFTLLPGGYSLYRASLTWPVNGAHEYIRSNNTMWEDDSRGNKRRRFCQWVADELKQHLRERAEQ